ncbi:hypothetical protein JW979_06175, partial [bacterium]|nr:hypothetical protein [candidate division CSSED10-310 bacterium]
DETFFAFAEDLDLSFRALIGGFKTMIIPKALVWHKVRATAAPTYTFSLYHRNLIWLIYKNLPTALLFLYLPHILANWLFIAVKSLFRGQFFTFILSLYKGIITIPKYRIERRRIQNSRKVSLSKIRSMLTGNWLGVHWKLYKKSKTCG